MVLNLTPKLVHLAQLEHRTNASTATSTDIYGAFTQISSVTTVSCYAFQQERTVIRASGASESLLEWNVILPKTYYTVCEEDSLTNIYTKDGVLIHAGGRIKEIQVYRKWNASVEVVHIILRHN